MTAAVERRISRRVPGGIAPGLRAIRLRTGQDTTLVDASQGGVGLETDARVSPGTPLEVVVLSHGVARTARAFVVYARVVGIDPLFGARYRVGLKVDSALRGSENVVSR